MSTTPDVLTHRHGQVSRRDFLETSIAASACFAVPQLLRRGSPWPMTSSAAVELEEATIAMLQEGMQTGEYTSERLCQLYLTRINELDRHGPALRSVIEVNPEAIRIARGLDAERKAGRIRGPMHGIPVLIKDNLATADRMETTAGSLAMVGAKPLRDSFVAARLRQSGAVILGKTNLSEWANFRSTNSVSGWSGRGGLCLSPYALDRNPCGSSSGTGAAIAASFATVGVGTETDGSVVCPSGANSLVGIKPTLGLVSRSGIIPIAHSQDTAGPMARTVTDAAILLGAMAGADARDALTVSNEGKGSSDYTQFLDPGGLKGARIGVARKRFFGYSDSADRLVNDAIEVMRGLGAEIVDPADIPRVGDYDDAEFTVLLYEFKADLNAYLADLGPNAPVRTLADLIAYNEANREREMPYFGQEIFLMAEEKGPLTDDAYVEALARCRRLSRTEGLDAVMAEHRLDAIVAPTGSPAWTTDLVNGDHFLGASSSPAAVSGYPNMTVPVGHVFGLPVGMSMMGKPFDEPTLIKLAYAYEQASQLRRPPEFLPTANLTRP
ncbi:MAG: amidase [Gemmatimonadales bacterium]|nr:amidase [Gemmatimonadales bacterium]